MHNVPRLKVIIYKSQNGNEPVRDWLKSFPLQDKKAIGEDIKTVQFGWPLGMPLVRKLETGLMVLSRNLRKPRWTTYRLRDKD